MRYFLGIICFLFFSALPTLAYAYIDPGSGGYLISYLVVAIGGVFAFASASVIYFFRNTVVRWKHFLWQKHRILFMTGTLLFIGAAVFAVILFFAEPKITPFNPALSGVHRYDIKKAYNGYNLFNGQLADMNGNIVNKWADIEFGALDKNGDYYANKIGETPRWGRYTWNDKPIWEKNFPIHHEIYLTPKDTLITFTKAVHNYNGRNVEFDIILEYDKNGKELQRFDIWEHFDEFKKYHRKTKLDEPLGLFNTPKENPEKDVIFGGDYDYYHLNTLSLTPKNNREGMHPAFAPGNWLISFRHGGMIFIVDKDTKKILWRAIDDQVVDKIEGPHSPKMLPNGNILLFDNGCDRGWSRIIEIDPATLKIAWEYKEKDFYTFTQGHVQKLPNGNMLISETEKGRVFELTPEKEIVWEFYNPIKFDETNTKEKKRWNTRQEIYRMNRFPSKMIEGLLEAKK